MGFLSSEVAFYLYKSSIQFNMEYFCHAWVIVPSCYLFMLNKQQKRVCWTVVLTLFAALEPVVHLQNVASLNFSIGITLVDVHLKWLNQFQFYILVGGPIVIVIVSIIFQLPFLNFIRMSMLRVYFLVQLDSGIFCLQIEFF